MPDRSRHIERIGRFRLVQRLYSERLKVAAPDIDEGIDLIAFSDELETGFKAIPIQLKAFSGCGFVSDKKYLLIPNLHIVYVWNVEQEREVRFFAMQYKKAEEMIDSKGWSRSKGRYARTRRTNALEEVMKPFEAKSFRESFGI